MIPTLIDAAGVSTTAAADAQTALAAGDSARAQEKYAEAGETLERELRGAADEETGHLLRFLAATQFYNGGHYRKALQLASAIEPGKLPPGTGLLLPRFLEDVKERASSGYEARVRSRLQTLWTARDCGGIIGLLQENPYHLPPANLAFIRAVCCEMLGKYRAAVLFFANAARLAPQDPALLADLAPLPLRLAGVGRIQEAWEYVQTQLELFPNAVSYGIASLLCYQRARHATEDARTGLLREQVQYFHRARQEYARLPPTHQSTPQIKAVMGLGYEAAAFALHSSGDRRAARELCDAAIAFDPASPNGWTLLGVIAAVSPEAIEAFKKAVALGDRTYFPYYYLAYDALTRRDFPEGLRWSRQALERGQTQDNAIKSLLYQWSAICLANLDAPPAEIGLLFKKALEIAPDNRFAQENYRRFQASETPEPPPLVEHRFLRDQRIVLPQPDQTADQVEGRLAAVAG